MATEPISPITLFDGVAANTNQTSATVTMRKLKGIAIQCELDGTTVSGTLAVKVSANNSTWSTLLSTAVTAADTVAFNCANQSWNYFQLVWTDNSSSSDATLTATCNVK